MRNAKVFLFLAVFCITTATVCSAKAKQTDANCQADKAWEMAFRFPAENGGNKEPVLFSYELVTDERFVVPEHATWVAQLYIPLAASELNGKILSELKLMRNACTGEAKVNVKVIEGPEQDLPNQPQPNVLAHSATGYAYQTQGRGPSLANVAMQFGTQTGLSYATMGPAGAVWSLIAGAPSLIQYVIHKISGRGKTRTEVSSAIGYDSQDAFLKERMKRWK